MLNDKFSQDLLDKLAHALEGTGAIPVYVFNEIEPVIEKHTSEDGDQEETFPIPEEAE